MFKGLFCIVYVKQKYRLHLDQISSPDKVKFLLLEGNYNKTHPTGSSYDDTPGQVLLDDDLTGRRLR